MKSLFILLALGGTFFLSTAFADIEANRNVTRKDMALFADLLRRASLAPELACEINSRESRISRKFTIGTVLVNVLEVEYKADFYGGLEETFAISTNARVRTRMVGSLQYGQIEEFRIELGDNLSSFVEFSHDGRGRLLGFLFGDINRVYPCGRKR